ncbi:MAG: hypothetical protein CMO81_05890 [Waddliaceae bacterium]|nr:hypothetical protein [Waddliaceae bacterium]
MKTEEKYNEIGSDHLIYLWGLDNKLDIESNKQMLDISKTYFTNYVKNDNYEVLYEACIKYKKEHKGNYFNNKVVANKLIDKSKEYTKTLGLWDAFIEVITGPFQGRGLHTKGGYGLCVGKKILKSIEKEEEKTKKNKVKIITKSIIETTKKNRHGTTQTFSFNNQETVSHKDEPTKLAEKINDKIENSLFESIKFEDIFKVIKTNPDHSFTQFYVELSVNKRDIILNKISNRKDKEEIIKSMIEGIETNLKYMLNEEEKNKHKDLFKKDLERYPNLPQYTGSVD